MCTAHYCRITSHKIAHKSGHFVNYKYCTKQPNALIEELLLHAHSLWLLPTDVWRSTGCNPAALSQMPKCSVSFKWGPPIQLNQGVFADNPVDIAPNTWQCLNDLNEWKDPKSTIEASAFKLFSGRDPTCLRQELTTLRQLLTQAALVPEGCLDQVG